MNSLASTLVLSGVLGYFILRHCFHRSRFRWDALAWDQNVFESTGVGLVLLGIGRLLAPWAHSLIDPYLNTSGIHSYVADRLPVPYPGSLILGTIVGVILASIGNRVWQKPRAVAVGVRDYGESLRILLHEAYRSRRPVMLTLDTRKVYVGPVFVPPTLREPSHVVLFPTLSGYRRQDTLEVTWTTQYADVYLELVRAAQAGEPLKTQPIHFQLVIPLAKVVTATYFDQEIWDRHFDPMRRQQSHPAAAP